MSTTYAGAPDAPARTSTATPILASLSIVLLSYNDEADLTPAVVDAHGAGERWAARHEVIVVDDGSSDRTREIAESIARGDARVRVIAHGRNRGYGVAVRTGIAASRGAWLLLTDAHLEIDLSELRHLVPLAADASLVAGYRVGRARPVGRRLAERAWGRLLQRTFGIAVRDVGCAFKLIRGPAVRALDLRSEGATISAELVVRAQQRGWALAEAGVHHRARPTGKSTGADALAMARALRERRALIRRLRADTSDASTGGR